MADLPVLSLYMYRSEKDGENINNSIFVENIKTYKQTRNKFGVIIMFNHRFSMFNILCGPWSILMPDAYALCFASGINIDLGAATNPRLNLILFFAGKHRKHPGGRGNAGGQHHHRINFDK